MKTIKYQLIIFTVLLFVCSFALKAFGQANQWKPPFKYYTPTYSTGAAVNVGASQYEISADQFSKGTTDDGYGLILQLNFNSTKTMKFLSFGNGNDSNFIPYLDIYYRNNSLVFRRFRTPTAYYDYVILDQLFDPGQGNEWTVQILFTGSFFWIETYPRNNRDYGTFLTPMYYGIDIPGLSNMAKFLAGNSNERIKIGDKDNIYIYSFQTKSFNYSELKTDIQTNFSSVTPYALQPPTAKKKFTRPVLLQSDPDDY